MKLVKLGLASVVALSALTTSASALTNTFKGKASFESLYNVKASSISAGTMMSDGNYVKLSDSIASEDGKVKMVVGLKTTATKVGLDKAFVETKSSLGKARFGTKVPLFGNFSDDKGLGLGGVVKVAGMSIMASAITNKELIAFKGKFGPATVKADYQMNKDSFAYAALADLKFGSNGVTVAYAGNKAGDSIIGASANAKVAGMDIKVGGTMIGGTTGAILFETDGIDLPIALGAYGQATGITAGATVGIKGYGVEFATNIDSGDMYIAASGKLSGKGNLTLSYDVKNSVASAFYLNKF